MAIENRINVELYPNAPGDVKVALMDQARVFLHATINEHWGVVVAEAMARGLPVVVHRSGGAWSDLAMGGEVGLGYEGVDEAVNALTRLLTDAKVWNYYSGKSLGRVGEITFDKFVSKLSELVRRLV
jgi:glycosyltransferase involved in cell wall biosynthesis